MQGIPSLRRRAHQAMRPSWWFGRVLMSTVALSLMSLNALAAAPAAAPAPVPCADISVACITTAETPVTVTLPGSGANTTFTISAAPAHGKLGDINKANGQVQYTPDGGYSGTDKFTFTATVNGTAGAEQTQQLIVKPSAVAHSVVTPKGVGVSGSLIGKGNNLVYSLATPAAGTPTGFGATVSIVKDTGRFTYAPSSSAAAGTDKFDFKVVDSTLDSSVNSSVATETVDVGTALPCRADAAAYIVETSDDLIALLKPDDVGYNPECAPKIESALRVHAFNLTREIVTLQQNRTLVTDANYVKTLNDRLDSDTLELQAIASQGVSADDLILGFEDYPAYYYYFYSGIAFTSIDKLFESGSPMIGLNIDHRFVDSFHILGSVAVTSSSETQTLSQAQTGTGLPPGKNALEFNLEPYWPVGRYDQEFRQGRWGPIVLIGERKTDDVKQFSFRRYVGMRSALNPDMYFDVLLGKTSGLDGMRWELRAQMPLSFTTFNNQSRFFIGAVANIHGNKSTADDAFVIYITWNLPFSKIAAVTQQGSGQSVGSKQ